MTILLGCIADDFTGATDLANSLVKEGMRTVVMLGVPAAPTLDGVDAVVIALKSRSNPAAEAVQMSLEALAWLRRAGVAQVYFKYCSTFDSTDQGNIGPVADALLDAMGDGFTVFCPAFPTARRTIYQGYLFVGDVLLSESGMRDHPLNPMTDPSLVRVLARQTPHRVGLVPYTAVSAGVAATARVLAQLRADGVRHAVLDAISDADLFVLGEACAALPLVTGGSGLAMALPANFRRSGALRPGLSDGLPAVQGHAAVLSGSCSVATQGQVAALRSTHPAFELDALVLAQGRDQAAEALAWAVPQLGRAPVLIYSTADPQRVAAVHAALGRERASALLESAMGRIARGLVDAGVRRLVVAGGETSGAVMNALQVSGLRIGPEIDPGVPWTTGMDDPALALALKSGNFGGPDFFARALGMLDQGA